MSKVLIFIFVLFLLAAGVWMVTFRTGSPAPALAAPAAQLPAFRLGVIPEKDLFQQRKAYRALGDYLEHKHALGLHLVRVELVTVSSYEGALKDFEEGQVDGAFVGSLVAILAADRYNAQVVLKSESLAGTSDYTSVIVVRADSPAHTFADLAGKRIGGVRTTSAGAVFPVYQISQLAPGLPTPTLVWSGTHDDVIRDVLFSLVDAGAVKSTRLDAYVRSHPEVKLRKIVESPHFPDNALVLRRALPEDVRAAVVGALLKMDGDGEGKGVLQAMGLNRFVPCDLAEYVPLFDLVHAMGPAWSKVDDGPAPQRLAAPPLPRGSEGGH